ncbi:MAG: hypothetical protein PHF30_00605 [Bacilli bacterium]|nr:hypothetical protein [Bacilli bacterium]
MSKKEKKPNMVKKNNKTAPIKTEKAKNVSAPIKKDNIKKIVAKKASVKNTKTKIIEPKKDIVFLDNVSANKCRHCHKFFEKELTICPFCHKDQKDNFGKIVIGILSTLLLLSIIGSHFLNKYYENKVSEDEYKFNCKLLSYEELVRKPNRFKNTDIKIIGQVVKVEGVDVSYGNVMNITIDANLFEGTNKQLITFDYIDKNYEIGFIEGDLITVYGEYDSINGNTPFVKAKYVVIGT